MKAWRFKIRPEDKSAFEAACAAAHAPPELLDEQKWDGVIQSYVYRMNVPDEDAPSAQAVIQNNMGWVYSDWCRAAQFKVD